MLSSVFYLDYLEIGNKLKVESHRPAPAELCTSRTLEAIVSLQVGLLESVAIFNVSMHVLMLVRLGCCSLTCEPAALLFEVKRRGSLKKLVAPQTQILVGLLPSSLIRSCEHDKHIHHFPGLWGFLSPLSGFTHLPTPARRHSLNLCFVLCCCQDDLARQGDDGKLIGYGLVFILPTLLLPMMHVFGLLIDGLLDLSWTRFSLLGFICYCFYCYSSAAFHGRLLLWLLALKLNAPFDSTLIISK